MAVAHSAASESHTGTTGSTNQASFSWTHTQSGTPKGVLVFVHTISASDFITDVTYGGLALERVVGAVAIDTAGEPGRTDLFFLGSGLGTGNQTITVTRTNNATVMYASAATVTAAADVTATGIQIEEQNQALTPVAIDDGSTGIDSLRYAATYYGGASPAPAGTGSTSLTSIDLGAFGNSMVRETTAGQGARDVGFNAGTDDVAAVYVAVRELTARSVTAETGIFLLTGNAVTGCKGFKLLVDAGAYVLTGNDVTFTEAGGAPTLLVDKGTYVITGNDVTLTKGYLLTVDKGTYTLTGQPVTFSRSYALPVDKGTYTLTGNDITTNRGFKLLADAGAYALTGNDITTLRSYQLALDAGAYVVTGNDATLLRTRLLSVDAGGFLLTGQPITTARSYVLPVNKGTYVLTGRPAILNGLVITTRYILIT